MNDIQPYQFEPEEPSRDEDDYDCLKKKWNHQRNHREKREH